MKKTIHSEVYRELIELLKAMRKNAGLTQQKLASRLNKPQSFVAKYESRERRLDVVELIQIATAMNQSIDPIVKKMQQSFMLKKKEI